MQTSKFEPSLPLQATEKFCHGKEGHHLEIEDRQPVQKYSESLGRIQSFYTITYILYLYKYMI